MKKINLLKPIIALGATASIVTPLTALTSCNANKAIDLVYAQYQPKDVTPLAPSEKSVREATDAYHDVLWTNPNILKEDLMWGTSYWIQQSKTFTNPKYEWSYMNFKVSDVSIQDKVMPDGIKVFHRDSEGKYTEETIAATMAFISLTIEGEYKYVTKYRVEDEKYTETFTDEGEFFNQYVECPFYLRWEIIDDQVPTSVKKFHIRMDNMTKEEMYATYGATAGIEKFLTQTEPANWVMRYKSTHVSSLLWEYDEELHRDNEYKNYSVNGKYTVTTGAEYDELQSLSVYSFKGWMPMSSYYLSETTWKEGGW